MGKRGDKRRKKKREAKGAKRIPYESFSYGPLRLERYGRNMVTTLDQSSPEIEQFREATREMFDGFPERYESDIARLAEMFAPHDAFEVIGYLWLSNSTANPETYKEWEHEGIPAAVELAAAVLLRRSARAGNRKQHGSKLDYEAVEARLRELLVNRALRLMSDAAGTQDPPDAFAMTRANAIAHRLTVRSPSYDWQERATVMELFDHDTVREDVLAACGFTATTALTLQDAIIETGLQRLHERGAKAREASETLMAKVKNPPEDPGDDSDAQVLRTLQEMEPAEAQHHIDAMLLAWIGHELGQTVSFTASDLAQLAGCDGQETGAYLSAFSIEFGEQPSHSGEIDIEDVRARPIVADGHGRYLCVSAPSLIWALRPFVEKALKEHDAASFKRFEHHRRAMVERRATTALAKALRADWAHEEIHYDGARDDQHGEIDGLLRIDTALLIVEAKASSMRPSARRLAQDSFRDWLKKEVTKAATQTRRAHEMLLDESTQLMITDRSGRPLTLNLDGIAHTFELIVVLEDLSSVAPSAWQLTDAGILPSDPTPLLISLHDLELICEIVERPTELIHYLKRRQRVDEMRCAIAPDELDYFMHYLLVGLFWEAGSDGTATAPVQLLSHTEQLDSYFFYKQGLRQTPAPRPSVKHHGDVRELLDCLDESKAPGRLDAALAILDFNEKGRRKIVSTMKDLKRRSALDHSVHDATIVSGDYAVTVMTAPSTRSGEVVDRLPKYGVLKKHQLKLAVWVGFGGWAGPPEPVQIAIALTMPWQPNPELDTLVASLPSAGTTGNFDGRAEARRRQRQARKTSREDTPDG